jgi:mannitol-1-phosphate/altronate dehydrogenase
MMSVWTDERKEIATWLSGYLGMVKTWVDRILDNENHEVDKIKIIGLIDEWIAWLEDTKLKIMKMKDIDPTQIKEKE